MISWTQFLDTLPECGVHKVRPMDLNCRNPHANPLNLFFSTKRLLKLNQYQTSYYSKTSLQSPHEQQNNERVYTSFWYASPFSNSFVTIHNIVNFPTIINLPNRQAIAIHKIYLNAGLINIPNRIEFNSINYI